MVLAITLSSLFVSIALVLSVAMVLSHRSERNSLLKARSDSEHEHGWGAWEHEVTRDIYASGGRTLPIDRKHIQKRACITCGLVERKAQRERDLT